MFTVLFVKQSMGGIIKKTNLTFPEKDQST